MKGTRARLASALFVAVALGALGCLSGCVADTADDPEETADETTAPATEVTAPPAATPLRETEAQRQVEAGKAALPPVPPDDTSVEDCAPTASDPEPSPWKPAPLTAH